jgi:hypothetical protein
LALAKKVGNWKREKRKEKREKRKEKREKRKEKMKDERCQTEDSRQNHRSKPVPSNNLHHSTKKRTHSKHKKHKYF